MKVLLVACVCVAMTYAQTISPPTAERDLPADILRDFPGACFASTACRVFQVGETWPLAPFCGRASCIKTATGLVEKVQDCGARPKNSPGCVLANEADLEKEFPTCCPKYICEAGAELLYPTEAEVKAAVAEAAAAQAAAAAAQTA